MSDGAQLRVDEGVETSYPESPWLVMKFGGTSVASADNWQRIATLIRDRLQSGLRIVVVHSALAGVSNLLENLLAAAVTGDYQAILDDIERRHTELAADLGVDGGEELARCFAELAQLAAGIRLVGEVSPRVHARVMATGELAATLLGSVYLQRVGLANSWVDARTVLQSRPARDSSERSRFLAATCDFGPDAELAERFAALQPVILTQGFIARNTRGDAVLLGRGGSDTSAAYVAAKLMARRLEIWTDVPGLFSANPRAVPSARLLQSLAYHEAQEIASAGGGVLHPRCIPPLRRYGIPLILGCTSHPHWRGTVVSQAPGEDTAQLKAISSRGGLTLVSMESMEMWQQVGFLAEAFDCFRAHGLSVDLVSTSESNVTVSIDVGASAVDPGTLDLLAEDLRRLCRVRIIEDCAAVTLVGRKIRGVLHELGPALEVFEEQQVHLVTQAANDLNLTFVIDAEHAYRLVQKLHGLLVGQFDAGGVFGPTWEQLLEPEAAPAVAAPPWWAEHKDTLLQIARREQSAYVYHRDSVLGSVQALRGLKSVDRVFYAMKANSHPELLRAIHHAGANLECVSPGEIRRVLEVLPDIDRRAILFTPNFAPRAEYEWAVEQGVWVTLDNLYPLRAWPELFAQQELFIRTDPGQGRGHHEHVRTAGVHSKFGVPLFEMEELGELVARADARVVGLHAHTGSGILTPDNWRDTGASLLRLARQFPHVRYLDLGGGLGIPEKPGQKALDLTALDAVLAEIKSAHPDYELWLEPGRFFVAQGGVLVAQVTQLKGKGEVQYLGVSTGMNSLIRPALYGAYHEIVNLSRLNEPATEIVNIVGPNCETGDRLGSDRLLPVSEEGDVILIANAGAYGYVMSSHYNLREPAREFVI